MRKKLFILLLAVAASVGTMFASTKIGDLYYNLDATNQTAEVTSQNSSYPYWSTTITTAIIPASVTYNSVSYSVTSIGDYAFDGCSGLISVTIGNSVTSIGKSAFRDCTGLTAVHISDLNAWCKIQFPQSYSSPLYYAHNLYLNGELVTDLVIPEGITTLGDRCFYGCTHLISATIPDGVTSIGANYFADCTGLTSVTIGSGLTSMAKEVFMNCSALTFITCEAVTPPTLGSNVFSSVNTSIPLYVPAGSVSAYQSADQWKDFTNILEETPGTCITASSTCGAQGGNLTWKLSCDRILTISGTGEMANYSNDSSVPWYSYRSSIQYVVIGNSVTSIGEGAFAGCTGLTSVTIGNSVTSIGVWAFAYCSGLTSIEIPNSVTSIGDEAFRGCSGLTSVTIPNSVTSIGGGAFAYCSGLTSVTISNGVTSIGENAFYGCSGLTSITCEAVTPPTLGSNVFSSVNTSIPLYVPAESVALYKAADQWKDFTNILPIEETPGTCITASGTCGAQGDNLTWELSCDSILTISGTGEMANYHNVSSVPWYSYNSSIQYVVIGNNVTSIGMSAFRDCTDLTSVTIPNSVTSIGIEAFRDCTGLTAVHISDLNAWCKIQFPQSYSSPLYYAHNLYLNGELVTNLVIPEGVTSIGNYAFERCSGLTSVTIPNSVTSIGEYAFAWCTGLTSVTIPNSVTSIGNNAFSDCTGLTSVTIPNSVTSIGGSAFYGCTSLTSVNITDIAAWCNIAFISYNSNPLYYAKHLYVNNVEVTNLVIPEGVTSIGVRAFYGCTSLTSVTIPNSVTSIGNYAFYGCSGLTSVTIPNSVTSIGESAFQYCGAITEVTIGSGLIALGKSVFNKCTALN